MCGDRIKTKKVNSKDHKRNFAMTVGGASTLKRSPSMVRAGLGNPNSIKDERLKVLRAE